MLKQTKKTLKQILTNLVDNPEDVEIEEELDKRGVLLTVNINNEDAPVVIGRKGMVIKSIKNVIRAIGAKEEDARVSISLNIPENDPRK